LLVSWCGDQVLKKRHKVMDENEFVTLIDYLEKVPSVEKPIVFGDEDGLWWVKFSLDLDNRLAWNVVQEFGHVMNYLSLEEKLPTAFYPVSPPPYINGGPSEFLFWVIETRDKDFKPEVLMTWLEGRLPRPVSDLGEWGEE
jgi:hypothetical protein